MSNEEVKNNKFALKPSPFKKTHATNEQQKQKIVRSHPIPVYFTLEELEILNNKAESESRSKTQIIIRFLIENGFFNK